MVKKFFSILLAGTIIFSLSACGKTSTEENQNISSGDSMQTESESTSAESISSDETGDIAKAERDNNARPEVLNMPEDISDYDTLFIGYPIWWHTAPMVIGTFLENYDLTGVEVYPFTQSSSMDEEQFNQSMDFVRECAKGANVHDGLFVEATDTDGIQSYLSENGF